MITHAESVAPRPAPKWHAAFPATIPTIVRYAKVAFRNLDPDTPGLTRSKNGRVRRGRRLLRRRMACQIQTPVAGCCRADIQFSHFP
jgi:hypothetical protein